MAMLDTENKSTGSLKHITHLPWIQGSVSHHPFADSIAYAVDLVDWDVPCRLASALTVGYYTSLRVHSQHE